MNYFAHIFVGKEFSAIMPSISKKVERYDESLVSGANLFVYDGEKILQYSHGEPTNIGNLSLSKKEDVTTYFVERIYNVVMQAVLAKMRVVFHFPLYKKEGLDDTIVLYDAIKASGRLLDFDFICYCDDLVSLLEPGYKITSPSKKQVKPLSAFKNSRQFTSDTHFVVLQGTNSLGVTLGLDQESFCNVLSSLVTSFAANYDAIFPSTAEYKDVVALGLSKLVLDKYIYTEYMLGKVLAGSIENSGSIDYDVDLNVACGTADRLLSPKREVLGKVFENIDGKLANELDSEAFTEYQTSLKRECEEILADFMEEFKHSPKVSVRTAILAAILNKSECELFSNTMFDQGLLNLDDMYCQALDYFVENNFTGYYQLKELPIQNKLKELRQVTAKLVNSQAHVKDLQKQLEAIEANVEKIDRVNSYTEDGVFHYGDHKFKLLPDIEQVPLEETYESHDVKAASVDLRSYFNEVRNQGQQGSCLAHAVTSVFEYMIKRGSKEECDLSEAFLYYNARKLDPYGDVDTTTDTGSRYKPAMDSLTQYGLAKESLCPYDENVYDREPSAEAYEDAATRKLVCAKNVLCTVNDVKSALSDGFPVAVSFSLYQSFFDSRDGFIPIPSEEEMAEGYEGKHSHHAMVIIGYSDKLGCFVLRNSWGDDWGDKGYCYVPYSYVENPMLCDMCCVITEVASLEIPEFVNIPGLRVDDSDLRTRHIILRAALANEQVVVERLKKQRDELKLYLQAEKALLISPSYRDEFIEKSETCLEEKIDLTKQELKDTVKEREELGKAFSRYRKITFALTFAAIAVFSLLVWGTWKIIYNTHDKMYAKEQAVLEQEKAAEEKYKKALPDFVLDLQANETLKPYLPELDEAVDYAVALNKVPGFNQALGNFPELDQKYQDLVKSREDYVAKHKAANKVRRDPLKNWENSKNLPGPMKKKWWFLFWALVTATGFTIVAFKYSDRWHQWREERDRLIYKTEKLEEDIDALKKKKARFKTKTYCAWAMIRALDGVESKLQSLYSNMISLINNLRSWHRAVCEKLTKFVTPQAPKVPEISLLDFSLLDAYYKKTLAPKPQFQVDFCMDMEKYSVEDEYFETYKANVEAEIKEKLFGDENIAEFDISAHLVGDTVFNIAVPVDDKMIRKMLEMSDVFLHFAANDIVIYSVAVIAPSVDKYKNELYNAFSVGSTFPLFASSRQKFEALLVKSTSFDFDECVCLKA